jgi:hypothetical protein
MDTVRGSVKTTCELCGKKNTECIKLMVIDPAFFGWICDDCVYQNYEKLLKQIRKKIGREVKKANGNS